MKDKRFPDLHADYAHESPAELTSLLTKPNCDEEYVTDDRMGLRPTDVIQMKLLRLLPSATVPVSCLHTRRDTRR